MDRFRRGDRRQPDASSGGGAEAGAEPGPVPETEPSSSRTEPWDGGWQRVAPPTVTVARSSIGVSDGLRFRSGLASWQNMAFGGELGHAVMPSAPVGLIHGVARPGGARPTSPGGPLLLRAARTGADGQANPAPATAGDAAGRGASDRQPRPTPVQRSSGTTPPDSSRHASPKRQATTGTAPATGTATATGPAPSVASAPQHPADTAATQADLRRTRPAVVRPRRTAPPLIVARRPAIPLRHITGIPPAAAVAPATPVTGAAARQPAPDRPSGPDQAIPAVPPHRAADRPAAETVRPALGSPLRELPAGAAPLGPAAQGGAVPTGPQGHQAAGMPVVQRQAPDAAAPSVSAPSTEGARPSARQQPTAEAQGPKTATTPRLPSPNPSAPESTPRQEPPSGPERRQHPGARRPSEPSAPPEAARPGQPDRPGSHARTRGGIGLPLPSLPPTARVRNDAPLLGDRRRAQPGTTDARRGGTSAGEPVVPPPATLPPATPVNATSVNAPSPMPVRSTPVPAPAASVPRPDTVQRAADSSGTPASGPTPSAARPQAVQRAVGTTGTPAAAPSPAAPAGPVRVRRIATEREGRGAPGRITGSGTQPPTVQRSRTLLAGRALTVRTGSGEGFSGPTAAATARPVVAATWRRDVRQPGSGASEPGSPGPGPAAHPTASGAAARPTTPHPGARPAEPVSPRLTRASGSGPAPRRPSRDGTVQRSPQDNPTPGIARNTMPAGPAAAGAPGRGPGAGRAGGGPPADDSSLRLVRRSAHEGAAVPPSPAPRQDPSAPSASSFKEPVPSAAPSVPVVRPHPSASARPGVAAVPVQRMAMPVVPESAGPAVTAPVAGDGAAPGAPPRLAVRVPQRAPAPASGTGGPADTARTVQRRAADAGIAGVPVKAAPAKPAAPSARTGPADSEAPATSRINGADIEELARRLLDPVSRLIRADLRRGRERAGRLYDGRR
ncbi:MULTISPECIES: hypothetical protein [unclassified Streptomyces]|uniref:hypothetical protein n=1 Tax=unclassified Streptomyces TaxID=2593676 RepID=UPI0036E13E81